MRRPSSDITTMGFVPFRMAEFQPSRTPSAHAYVRWEARPSCIPPLFRIWTVTLAHGTGPKVGNSRQLIRNGVPKSK